MKKTFIFCLLSLFVLGGNVFAGNTWYDNNTGDGLWRTADNWTAGLPSNAGSYEWVAVSEPVTLTIDSSTTASTFELYFGHSASVGGQILNITGGTLDVNYNLWLGATPFEGIITFNMSGGVFNVGTFVGAYCAGNHLIATMTGGTMNISGTLGIPFASAVTNSAVFHLNGGVINAGGIQMSQEGLLEINGGTLILNGNQTALINTYIANAWIKLPSGSDPRATIKVSYDNVSGKTTVSKFMPDLKQAWNPSPSDSSYYVSKQPTLTWTAGDGAISHDVYIGKYGSTLSLVSNAVSPSYAPVNLEWGQAYTWRIDEWNGTTLTTGLEWTFTVTDHVLIEDFQSYNDLSGLAAVWSGTDANSLDPNNGLGIYLKTGTKSFKLTYDNSVSPYYTEISRSYSSDQDWTYAGIKAISLWFNFADATLFDGMYVELSDGTNTSVLTNADAFADIDTSYVGYQEIQLNLSQFTGVNLTKIRRIAIGMGSKISPTAGHANTVHIDEIRLYPKRCLEGAPVGDLNGDCKVDFSDFAELADAWLTDGLWPKS